MRGIWISLYLIVAASLVCAPANADSYGDAMELIRLLKKEGKPQNTPLDVSSANAIGQDSTFIEYEIIKEPPMPIYGLRVKWQIKDVGAGTDLDCLVDISTTYYASHSGGMWRRIAIAASKQCADAVRGMSKDFPEILPRAFDDIVRKTLADLRKVSL